ncbi:hypothetical protein J6590_003120, partial [Homalodisca vitripennis]
VYAAPTITTYCSGHPICFFHSIPLPGSLLEHIAPHCNKILCDQLASGDSKKDRQ